jgi:hypothetical protein
LPVLAAYRGRALFFGHLVAERGAFRIVLLEPLISKLWRREYLEMVDVANFLAGVDMDSNGCHWSLLSVRRISFIKLARFLLYL